MKTFKLTAKITISVYTDIEAETIEEAIRISNEKELMSIVNNGFDTPENAWMADELDGSPYNIREE